MGLSHQFSATAPFIIILETVVAISYWNDRTPLPNAQ